MEPVLKTGMVSSQWGSNPLPSAFILVIFTWFYKRSFELYSPAKRGLKLSFMRAGRLAANELDSPMKRGLNQRSYILFGAKVAVDETATLFLSPFIKNLISQ
jgi:hypothetical protein